MWKRYDIFSRSRWSRIFREDVEVASAIIFVGYSLYDLDIARALYASERISGKCVFVTRPNPSEVDRFKLARFGAIVDIGSEAAGHALTALKKIHVPAAPMQVFKSFHAIEINEFEPKSPAADDVFRLAVLGEVDLGFVPGAFTATPTDYYVPRRAVTQAINLLQQGSRAVVLHSFLANGKTLATHGVAFRALQLGYEVFRYDLDRGTLTKECVAIRESRKPTLVIVEDYPMNLDVLEKLKIDLSVEVRLLLTARTPIHLINWTRLEKALGDIKVSELSIDWLSDNELVEFDELLERNGLLGSAAGLHQNVRRSKMGLPGHGEFRNILLWLLDSADVKQRLDRLFKEIPATHGVRDVVIVALLLRHINQPSDLAVIADLAGVDRLNEALFSHNAAIAELLNFTSGRVVVRSSMFSAQVLGALWASTGIADILAEVLRRAFTLQWDNRRYWDVARDLMRFSQVIHLIPKSNHEAHLIAYYEGIRNIPGCAKNTFFWLQYAIARISISDYPLAERYLNTAYSLAEKIPNFDTYQLDNTRARLLLARIADGKDTDSFAHFIEASRIVNRQAASTTQGHYPYRVASLYGDVWNQIQGIWSAEQKGVLLAACGNIKSRLSSVDSRLQKHPDVLRCVEVMRKLFAK